MERGMLRQAQARQDTHSDFAASMTSRLIELVALVPISSQARDLQLNMFSNLSYQDKEAFFSLLDEYFASRPHLLSGGGGGGSSAGYSPVSATPAAPVRSRSSSNTAPGGRTLPPPAPASSSRSPPPMSPPASAGTGANGEKPDMATRMVTSGFKLGASGARKGLGMLSKNEQAMNALGRAGAAGMIRSAQAGLGPGKNGQQPESPQSPTGQQPMSPPPTRTAAAAVARAAQAKAVYDYSSGDSGDLSVQGGQVVTIVEKTSADWWTCEDGSGRQGLVPSSYLQEM